MKKILTNVRFELKLFISLIYIGIIIALSLLPTKDLPQIPLFPGADKIIHMIMYFTLAFILLWTFQHKKIVRWKLYGFIVALGLIMEIMQVSMHLGRSFSLLDMLANITGAFLGVMTFRLLKTQPFV